MDHGVIAMGEHSTLSRTEASPLDVIPKTHLFCRERILSLCSRYSQHILDPANRVVFLKVIVKNVSEIFILSMWHILAKFHQPLKNNYYCYYCHLWIVLFIVIVWRFKSCKSEHVSLYYSADPITYIIRKQNYKVLPIDRECNQTICTTNHMFL